MIPSFLTNAFSQRTESYKDMYLEISGLRDCILFNLTLTT